MQLLPFLVVVALTVSACAHHATANAPDPALPPPPTLRQTPGDVDLGAHRRLDLQSFLEPTSNWFVPWTGGHFARRKLPDGTYAHATLPDLTVFAEMPARCVPTTDGLLFECGDAVRNREGRALLEGAATNPEGFLTRMLVNGGRWVVFGRRSWTVFDQTGALGELPPPRAADIADRRLMVDHRFVQYHGSGDSLVFDTATFQATRIPHGTPYIPAAGGAARGEGVMRAADGTTVTWNSVEQDGTTFDEARHGERAWRCARDQTMRPCLQVVATHTGEVLVMQRVGRSRHALWRADGTSYGALDGVAPTTTPTVSHDGRHLLLSVSGGLEIVALDTLRPIVSLAGHRTGTVRFDTLPGHSRFISCDGAGMAVLWESASPSPLRHLGFPGCEGLAFARDGSRFIAGHTVFDADGNTVLTLPNTMATALSLDGRTAFAMGYVEGRTFDERRVVLQAFPVTTPTAPAWSVTLPQRRLLDAGLAVVADRAGAEHLVVGTGDAAMVVDPQDGRIVRKLAGPSPSAPMALRDRSGVALAFGTAGNDVQLVSIAADGWKTRTVARWKLVDNALPLHVQTFAPDADWLIPGDTKLHLQRSATTIAVPDAGLPGAGAVSAVPLDATRWLVGMRDGSLRVIDSSSK